MLKDMFADNMEDMLKADLDTELGYSKNSQAPKTTDNRRNGNYLKTVTSSMGEIELNIPRDRMSEYEPEFFLRAQETSARWRTRCWKYQRQNRQLDKLRKCCKKGDFRAEMGTPQKRLLTQCSVFKDKQNGGILNRG
mgnify:CR=1 FL=1